MVSRTDALILLGMFAVFMFLTIRDALNNRVEEEEDYPVLSPARCLASVIGGIAAIVYGGNMVVDSASAIARSFGLSQTLIGLTIVALGTSLPELVTSMVASKKGENGLALGNVIGSNIFNILMVLALSSAVKPVSVSAFSVFDAVCLIGFSVIVWLLCWSRQRISRLEGWVMLILYAVYTGYIIMR